MTSTNKISLEPAFVLHRRPYQETSIIVDFFTRKYGRINAVAKGAKRPKSPLRSVLSPASKLSISLSGKNDLKTLSSAEILNHYTLNNSQSLNSIVYINELLTKAIEKEDPHKHIFDLYEGLLMNMSSSHSTVFLEGLLREFELSLLQGMGYGVDLVREAETNKKIKRDLHYSFNPDQGFLEVKKSTSSQLLFPGEDIINFSEGDFEKKTTRNHSKIIMRIALDYHLGNKTINIRKYLTKE